MFRSYLVAALRNLARNKLYAIISISGLAVALSTAILIMLFVRHELTYDRFIPGHEHVYRVSETYHRPGEAPFSMDVTLASVAPALRQDYAGIDAIARLSQGSVGVRAGDVEQLEDITWADPDFFKVMPLPTVSGDADATLRRPDGVVLTRAVARKYFGRSDPIGQTLTIDREHSMRVGAVIENLPRNSHLQINILGSSLAPYSKISQYDASPIPARDTYTYFRLAQNAAVDAIGRDFPAFVKRHWDEPFRLDILPLSEIHLLKPGRLGAMKAPTDRRTLGAMTAVAFLIIAVAGINYAGLTTARAGQRAIEIGVRKACGAQRRQVASQFLGESLICVGLALLVAIASVELALPYFNAAAFTNIAFDYWREPVLLAGMLGLLLGIAALAGLYPALMLSGVRPAAALKASVMSASGSPAVRSAFVAVLFAVLIGVVLFTATVYAQVRFTLFDTLRVPTDQIVLVEGACNQRIQAAVLELHGVQSVACSAIGSLLPTKVKQAGSELRFFQTRVDFGFLELYGFSPLAGRFFSERFGADRVAPDAPASIQPNVVINEAALQKLGFSTPADAIGKTVSWVRGIENADSKASPSIIVGVVDDFPDFSSGITRTKVEPQIFYVAPSAWMPLNIRLDGAMIPETLNSLELILKNPQGDRPLTAIFLNRWMQQQMMDVIREAMCFAFFAAVALLLSCMGMFGLAAFTAEQRTKEVGVRKTMGAGTISIMRLLVWQFTKPVLWANLIAWPVAGFVMNRWLHGFAYRIELEPWLFITTSAAALLIALLTVSTHCYLVARAKPVTALRYE